jgi:multicomponent Na+:H+ antiporter subunit C
MENAQLFGLCGAALIGIAFYGFIANTHLLRRLVAFNVIGSGIFLLFGAAGYRRPELGADPIPQALVITGIVVALSATALVAALVTRYAQHSGSARLPEEQPPPRDSPGEGQ